MKKTKKTKKRISKRKSAAAKLKTLSLFLESFKRIDKRYITAALYFASFVIAFNIIMWLAGLALTGLIEKAAPMLDLTEPAVEQLTGAVVSMYVVFVLAFFAAVLAFTIASLGVWTAIMKKKFKIKLVCKLCLVNLVLITFIIMVLFSMLAYLQYYPLVFLAFAGIFALIIMHLKFSFYYAYVEEERVRKALKKLFDFGIKKIHRFILPVLLILIVFLILSMISTYVLEKLPYILYKILATLLLLFFIIWMRFYYALVIDEVYAGKK